MAGNGLCWLAALLCVGVFVGVTTSPGVAQQRGASVNAPAPAIKWHRVRYAIVVGDMRNASGYIGANLTKRLQDAVQQRLAKSRRLAVLSPGQLTGDLLDQLGARALPTFRLEGNVASVRRGQRDGQTSVRAEVSLILMDESGRNMRSILKGAATGVEPPMGSKIRQERKLARRAVNGAVESALADPERAIRGAASVGDARLALASRTRR